MEKSLIGIVAFYYAYMIFLGIYMFIKRKQKIKQREIKVSYFRAYTGEVPHELTILQNHFTNQFQIPVLFMIAILFNIQSQNANMLALVFSLIFVVSRICHSIVHLGYNNVLHRAFTYFIGAICVLGLFINALV